MIPTYTAKCNRKYRYYVCANAQKFGYENCPTRSVRADEIEKAVIGCVRKIVAENSLVQADIVKSELWDALFPQEQRRILNMIIERIDYCRPDGDLSIILNQKGLQELADEVQLSDRA